MGTVKKRRSVDAPTVFAFLEICPVYLLIKKLEFTGIYSESFQIIVNCQSWICHYSLLFHVYKNHESNEIITANTAQFKKIHIEYFGKFNFLTYINH